jgi:phage/plasmid-associated DNA primase
MSQVIDCGGYRVEISEVEISENRIGEKRKFYEMIVRDKRGNVVNYVIDKSMIEQGDLEFITKQFSKHPGVGECIYNYLKEKKEKERIPPSDGGGKQEQPVSKDNESSQAQAVAITATTSASEQRQEQPLQPDQLKLSAEVDELLNTIQYIVAGDEIELRVKSISQFLKVEELDRIAEHVKELLSRARSEGAIARDYSDETVQQASIRIRESILETLFGDKLNEAKSLAEKLGVSLATVWLLRSAQKSEKANIMLMRFVKALINGAMERFHRIKKFYVEGNKGVVDLGIYCWDGRRYKDCEEEIKAWLGEVFKALEMEKLGIRYTVLEREFLTLLKDMTTTPMVKEHSVIAFKNAAFDWRTYSFMPHDPDVIAIHFIPHEVDVELFNYLMNSEGSDVKEVIEKAAIKKAPKTLTAFKQWVGEKWILLFEILGSLFYPWPIKKLVLFTDAEGRNDGDTGKSTCIRYFETVIGDENRANVPLQRLTDEKDRFATSFVYGKLGNFYADLPSEALTNPGRLKMISGEDTVNVEFKGKQGFSWRMYTKMIFSANKPPPMKDDDPATWTRWLVVLFEGSFQKIHRFEETFIDEIPQAIAIALYAFINVLKRNVTFSYENTPEDARHIWMSRSDSVYAFLTWALKTGVLYKNITGKTVITDELYSIYTKYCAAQDIHAIPINMITKRLKELKQFKFEIKSYGTKKILVGYSINQELAREELRKLGYEEEEEERGGIMSWT